jgi:hypothetical protein
MKSFVFLFAFALLVGCNAHDHADEHSHGHNHLDYQRIKKIAESSSRNFNPGFVSSFHYARLYSIRNYNIYDTLSSGQRKQQEPGPIIKRMAGEVPGVNSKGDFHVVFLSERDTVHQYRMQSPLYVRLENGPDRGLFKVKTGLFYIPVPELKNITEIVLKDNDGTELVSKFR